LWFVIRGLVLLLGIGGVAFVTLLERKILGLSQIRLGPNKVTFLGILQPLADGIKLLTKQNVHNKSSQFILFYTSPIMLIILFLLLWRWVIPWEGNIFLIKHRSLLFFRVLGIRAYAVIIVGWSSTRGFSKLGRMRGILQSLSYEVSLIIIFMFFLFLIKSFNIMGRFNYRRERLWLWLILWLILSLIERNRAPFDLLEGERELIRGFNIEIGRLIFVYLFLREYGMVIVIAAITDVVLTNRIGLFSMFIVIILLLIRSCFPRVRYDTLIILIWQCILPLRVLLILFRI